MSPLRASADRHATAALGGGAPTLHGDLDAADGGALDQGLRLLPRSRSRAHGLAEAAATRLARPSRPSRRLGDGPAEGSAGRVHDRVVDPVAGRRIEVAGAGHEPQRRGTGPAEHAARWERRLGPALESLDAEVHAAAVGAPDPYEAAALDFAQPV
jgi:hypothetical protein